LSEGYLHYNRQDSWSFGILLFHRLDVGGICSGQPDRQGKARQGMAWHQCLIKHINHGDKVRLLRQFTTKLQE
jgi:hypothetical protein